MSVTSYALVLPSSMCYYSDSVFGDCSRRSQGRMQESVINGLVPDREEIDGVRHPIADEGRGRKVALNAVAPNAIVDVVCSDALRQESLVRIVRG